MNQTVLSGSVANDNNIDYKEKSPWENRDNIKEKAFILFKKM